MTDPEQQHIETLGDIMDAMLNNYATGVRMAIEATADRMERGETPLVSAPVALRLVASSLGDLAVAMRQRKNVQ